MEALEWDISKTWYHILDKEVLRCDSNKDEAPGVSTRGFFYFIFCKIVDYMVESEYYYLF